MLRRRPTSDTHHTVRPVCAARTKAKRGHLETSIIEIPALDAFAAEAEERGKVEAADLDALVLEHELDEEAVTAFKTLLSERGVELPAAEEEEDFELDLSPGSGPVTTDSLGMPLFVVLKPGRSLDGELVANIRARIRDDCSPRHVPDEIRAVPAVPRTLSGKVLEVPVKRILSGEATERAVSRDSLVDPEALRPFEELAASADWRTE